MNHFSTKSQEKLKTCHRDLQVLFNHVILEYDCTVICGFRGEAEQNAAFEAGNSQLQYPKSKHNSFPSMAVDVAPHEQNGIDWNREQCIHFAGYVKGVADQLYRIGTMKYHIRGGIDWNQDNDINDTKFFDACHFEIVFQG